jgi:hypothetical protein
MFEKQRKDLLETAELNCKCAKNSDCTSTSTCECIYYKIFCSERCKHRDNCMNKGDNSQFAEEARKGGIRKRTEKRKSQ